MSRVGYVFGALLLIVCVAAPAFAQQPFADVPLNHWAYNAVNSLAEKGVLEGYPEGTFGGKKYLTRYEFAQAVARLLARLEEMKGVPGPKGDRGAPGPAGPPGTGAGLTPEQQQMIDRLAKEFGPELKSLRSDLDSLTKRVEDLEAAPEAEAPAITVSGDISWRLGLYGTSLGIEDVDSSGYPFLDELIVVELAPVGEEAPETRAMAPYGGINIPYYDAVDGWSDAADFPGGPTYTSTIPISDALKDAYKPSDFMTMRTRVSFSGQLAEDTSVNVTLLAGAETNDIGSGALDWSDGQADVLAGSPLALSGNGVMDTVAVDEAWLMHSTRFLAPVDLTVGKQYFSRAQGLLADNDQESIKALRADWDTGNSLSWGAVLGMLDREQFYGRSTGTAGLPALTPVGSGLTAETSGQDNYHLYYLDWDISDSWGFGANWLDSGLNQEQGWSASLDGKLYGLDFYGEYAQLTKWPDGEETTSMGLDLDESDNAWMGGLRWSNPAVCVTGEYGRVDPGYAIAFTGGGWSVLHPLAASMGMYGGTDYLNLPLSALHPNAEVDPHYINWIDRPLFLDPTNIAKGWHVNVTFPKLLGPNTPVSVSYMDGDGYEPRYLYWLSQGGPTTGIAEPDQWRDADSVWVVKVSRQLSESVSANVLYGRREVDNIMSGQDVPVDLTDYGVQGTYYAEDEPIQVIRAEVCVAF
jgi:hypothetical protein